MMTVGSRSLSSNGCALLFGDMGTGKTLVSFLLAFEKKSDKPVLFVCTISLVGNVENEIKKFFKDIRTVIVTSESDPDTIGKDVDVVITNRECVKKRWMSDFEWGPVIIDEAHDLRNPKTQRYKSFLKLKSSHRILLTGTPVNNFSHEILSLIHI